MSTRNTRSGKQPFALEVSLLGRVYTITCDPSEHAELEEAVAMLDRRMRDIRDGGKVSNTERIAVMAALNFAHDLLRARRDAPAATPADVGQEAPGAPAIDDAGARRRIEGMRASIEEVLGGQEKLF